MIASGAPSRILLRAAWFAGWPAASPAARFSACLAAFPFAQFSAYLATCLAAFSPTLGRASAAAPGDDRFGFHYSGRLKPSDYLIAPRNDSRYDLFDTLKPIDAGVDLKIGADCGKINIDATLRSAFDGLIHADKYFKGLITDIIGAAPMLTACYFSPTWCAILKHTQISASLLGNLRLNQCQIIDKYTDDRTEDYYRARQSCSHASIAKNGGDMESAMAGCQDGFFEKKVGNWSGKDENPAGPNKLLADSARWAGVEGAEGDRTVQLLQAMVGDTVLAQGVLRVEFGPRARALSPRAHLQDLESSVRRVLCEEIVPEIARELEYGVPSDAEIRRKLSRLPLGSAKEGTLPLTPATTRSLALLPPARRDRLCPRIAETLALAEFSRDMNGAFDLLTLSASNPNLPPHRRAELLEKRRALKEQVDLAVSSKKDEAQPLAEISAYLAREGTQAREEAAHAAIQDEVGAQDRDEHLNRLQDCSDGILCGAQGGSP